MDWQNYYIAGVLTGFGIGLFATVMGLILWLEVRPAYWSRIVRRKFMEHERRKLWSERPTSQPDWDDEP